MYTSKNFKTKKAFKEAVKSGEEVILYQPGPFANYLEDAIKVIAKSCGKAKAYVEGPHYPEPHRWYAQVMVDKNLKVLSVK